MALRRNCMSSSIMMVRGVHTPRLAFESTRASDHFLAPGNLSLVIRSHMLGPHDEGKHTEQAGRTKTGASGKTSNHMASAFEMGACSRAMSGAWTPAIGRPLLRWLVRPRSGRPLLRLATRQTNLTQRLWLQPRPSRLEGSAVDWRRRPNLLGPGLPSTPNGIFWLSYQTLRPAF